MKNNRPIVSIALPVYNQSKFISLAIDSILNQSYTNIQLFIIDNCSTDGTSEICQAYAAKDHRIKYHKNNQNIGSAGNFQKGITYATSVPCDYFMLARSEAILSKNLIEEMIDKLKKYEDVTLAFAKISWIDDAGNILDQKPIGFCDTRGYDIINRVALVLCSKPFPVHGLMRAKHAKYLSTRPWWQSIGFDHIILHELAIIGSFCYVDNVFWGRRYKYDNETFNNRVKRYKNNLLKKANFFEKIFPFSKLAYYLLFVVIKSNLRIIEKLKCLLVVIFLAITKYIISKGKSI